MGKAVKFNATNIPVIGGLLNPNHEVILSVKASVLVSVKLQMHMWWKSKVKCNKGLHHA